MTSVEQPSASFRPAVFPGSSPSPRSGHLPFASDLVAALKPSLIVQLGVGSGDYYFGLCQFLAESSQKSSLYGIDTWPKTNGTKPQQSAFDAVSRRNGSAYQGFSHLVRKTFDEALPQFEKNSIDLLDIEGLQPYDALHRTMNLWLDKVQPGGMILLHNISLRTGDSGASRLWNELKTARLPHFAFRHNNGLGIIAKSFEESSKIPFVASILDAPPEERSLVRRYYVACAERIENGGRPAAPAPAAPPPGHLPPAADAVHSLFQVFRSQDGQYAASPELTHAAAPGVWVNLRIDLPRGLGDKPLRLDVASKPAVVDIATLNVRNEDGHIVWSWNPKAVADQPQTDGSASRLPEPEFFRVLALAPNARVYLPDLPGTAFQQPLELEIRFRIDLELKALKQLTQQKSADAGSATPAALEAAMAKAKSDSAKYLAQSRIEYEAKIRQLTAEADGRLDATRSELDALRSEMEVLKSRHREDMEGHAALLEEERAHHQGTRLEKETLVAQHTLMLQEVSIAQGNVDELKAEVERLSGEFATSEFDLSELRKLNARMAAALEEERATRIQMQESGSWRLTKPIRAVGDLFGPRRKY